MTTRSNSNYLHSQSGSWMVLAAAICWGTTGTAQAYAPDGANPLVIGAVRMVIGGLFLLVFALLRGSFHRGEHWPVLPTLLAGLSMVGYNLLFFSGVARTGVAVGTLVGIGSTPILAGLLGYIVFRERPNRWWVGATVLAVIGCGLLISAGSSLQGDLLGILLAIGAGFSYAVFTVVSKGLLDDHEPEAVMGLSFIIGAVIVLPVLFRGELAWVSNPAGIGVALHLGIITNAFAYSLFARGLKLVSVATAATLTLGEPLTAGLLAIFLLGEQLTIGTFVGILLLFSGLVLVTYGQNRSHHPLLAD